MTRIGVGKKRAKRRTANAATANPIRRFGVRHGWVTGVLSPRLRVIETLTFRSGQTARSVVDQIEH
ncbi:MAG: hypothetical protein CBB71_07525 [Rhodopirellula sp. TMED11]|nr:MAG: hypothetical protein CBB71_07525 [Rhodopirellula sp. TMED11]